MATQQTTQTYTQKILFTGVQAAIDDAQKSNDGLYFASDTQKLYKGEVDYSQAARVVTSMPVIVAKNSIYVLVDNTGAFVKAVAVDSNGAQKDISYQFVTSATGITKATASDVKVATEKAIVEYIDSIVGDETITAISSSTVAGSIEVTVGDGSEPGEVYNVNVPGVALKPSYNAENRIITIPYTENGADPAGSVVINLGKDLVVQSGRYNAATEEIWLWITGDDPSGDPSIVIPVGDLVDEIVGGTTDTATTTYNTTTNALTADVRISAKSDNHLQVLTAQASASEDGLYVDFSGIESDLADIRTDINTVQTNVDNLEAALTTWTVLG
jgi:hypothetical protein